MAKSRVFSGDGDTQEHSLIEKFSYHMAKLGLCEESDETSTHVLEKCSAWGNLITRCQVETLGVGNIKSFPRLNDIL